MASDSAGKPVKPLVVGSVDVSRNWKGAYQADYPCPRCKAPLASQGDTLLGTDTCPNCKTTFAFAPDVQSAYWSHKQDVEFKAAEKRRTAEQRKQIADERAREAEAEREQQFAEGRDLFQRSIAEKKILERKDALREGTRRASVANIEFWLDILVGLSLFGLALLVVLGIMFFAMGDKSSGFICFVTGLSALPSLLLIYSLFRCLFAIHQLLMDISDKLDRDQG